MPIVPIRIKSGDVRAAYKSVLSYGRSRSGKTRWAASWPRPLFIAEASERGWGTIETMPADQFYEPDRVPLVWPVNDAQEMAEALRDAKPMVLKGEVSTIVVDSLTFLQDAHFAYIKKRTIEANPGQKVDTRALYGALGEYLASLRQDVHGWPCNVIWTALEKPPGDDSPTGGPLLTGKARERFPAGCDFVFYHRSYTLLDDNQELVRYFEMHTQVYEKWLAGGRDSGMLEPSIFNATYREFAAQLGLPEFFVTPAPVAVAPPPQRRAVNADGKVKADN